MNLNLLCVLTSPEMIRLVTALVLAAGTVSAFKIGAFNIQSFGDSKMNNPEVRDVIMQVKCPSTIYRKSKSYNFFFTC